MPKLKVPTVTKPAKKQMTLLQFQRRPLHTPSPDKTGEACGTLMDQHPGRTISPKKQNGLKPISKGFSDAFGDSEDEVSVWIGQESASFTVSLQREVFVGFSLANVLEEYHILAKASTTVTPEKMLKVEAVMQRSTRPRRGLGYL